SGGTSVKVRAMGRRTVVRIASDPRLTAKTMVRPVRESITGWSYSRVSIGYPGVVMHGNRPRNLYTLLAEDPILRMQVPWPHVHFYSAMNGTCLRIITTATSFRRR